MKNNTRFDVHEGSDCVVRYLPHVPRNSTIREIVYGPVLYSIHLKWKEHGQAMYLQRLLMMGLIPGGASDA